MSTFAQFQLHKYINDAIQACGYTQPTPVQQQCIPEILNRRDVVASAQTGTGKTASFVLPALHQLSQQASKKTRILILTPTRELAAQITKSANTYGKFLKFNIVSLVGGMPYHHQIRDLSRGADIIVATPGRLIDHLENKRVDLSQIEMLVLDEADRMLDMGFIDDVKFISNLTPANRQTLLFSATVDNRLNAVIKQLLKNPIRIDLSSEKMTAPKIKQELYKANNAQHKTKMLKHFLNDANIYKAIIFSATKINADRLADQLRESGYLAAALHGDLRQNVRNRTIEQLRRGKIQFLVATDVAARGIDISDITHVINYDLPKFCEDYVHRIGRTGRAGKSGTAISFVLPSEAQNLKRIERYIGQRLQIIQHINMTSDVSEHGPIVNEPKFAEQEDADYSRPARQKRKHEYASDQKRDKKFHRTQDSSKQRHSRGDDEGRRYGRDGVASRSSRDDAGRRYGRDGAVSRSSRDDEPRRYGRDDASRSDRKSRHFDERGARKDRAKPNKFKQHTQRDLDFTRESMQQDTRGPIKSERRNTERHERSDRFENVSRGRARTAHDSAEGRHHKKRRENSAEHRDSNQRFRSERHVIMQKNSDEQPISVLYKERKKKIRRENSRDRRAKTREEEK